MSGSLFVVAVPIGNLEDITVRALRVLRDATLIACEDTRRTGKLLELLEIPRPRLMSVHDHNESDRIPALLRHLETEDLVLVSDAGTPAISDPGFKLTRAVIAAGHAVVPIPGVSAVITSLCAAGLPTDQFRFVGFLPPKKVARQRALDSLAEATETLVFYVSPHGLLAVLEAASGAFGPDRPAVIARELTKKFEEFRRGSLAELVAEPGKTRGEMVLLVGGASPDAAPTEASLTELLQSLMASGYSPSRAAKEAARRTGAARNEAYRIVTALQRGG